MITYNDLYEAARKERYSDQLQPIPKNFVTEVANYLREKREITAREDDGFSDAGVKTKKQVENAATFFKELMSRRRKKILHLVFVAAETGISKQDFENMLAFEKELFEEIMKCIDTSDKKVDEIFNGKQEVQKNELIVFVKDVEEFVGLDGGKMGPYEQGQIANLPREIATILIADEKAEVIEG